MAGILDKIIVIDIESTCWRRSPPPGQEMEIIEIGLCLLDTHTFERSGRESTLVKPVRSQVSEFCTHLTSLTQEQVDTGISFDKALRHLRRFHRSRDRAWASFGDYDRRQFERQCASFGLKYPFGPTHFNIKALFALTFGLDQEVELDEAVKRLNLTFEGNHHRGVDDAWNAAAVFTEIIRRLRSPQHP